MFFGEVRAKNIAAYAHNTCGVELNINGRLAVVSHGEPHEKFVGLYLLLLFVAISTYFAIIVFEIGAVGICT